MVIEVRDDVISRQRQMDSKLTLRKATRLVHQEVVVKEQKVALKQ